MKATTQYLAGACGRAFLLSVFIVAISGCASRPINQPITQVDPKSGYRGNLHAMQRQNNRMKTLFVLSFSGGGTRAAALSYGVLNELRKAEFTAEDGKTRRVIDEVDIITGVSGGSFTALSYALYQDRLFDEYEQRFLKRNVQGDLAKRSFLYPSNWFKLMSGNYGRSEVAAQLYDEILFENKTFNDLIGTNGPFAAASTTDITTGSRFAYYQDDFDLICSDLGSVKLSRAAATSSAVPIVLSPVTLNNYGGNCGYEYPAWVKDIQAMDHSMRPIGRSLERYKEMQAFQDSANSPYIHLVDGGVSDNIGVRGVLESLEEFFISAAYQQEKGFVAIDRIILLVVNAKSTHDKDWEKKESPPGSIKQLSQSTGVPIEKYSFETVELMKDRAEVASWRRRLLVAEAQLAGATKEEAEARYPDIDFKVLDVNFENLPDAADREYFMNLPTSFVLKDEQVDRLIDVGSVLLRQSPTYQQVLQDFGATIVQ
jgi:NTE family protein